MNIHLVNIIFANLRNIMEYSLKKFVCLLIIFMHASDTLSSQSQVSCDGFNFSQDVSKGLIIRENTVLNLTFSLVRARCQSLSDVFISVSKDEFPVCHIQQKNLTCQVSISTKACFCSSLENVYHFSKKVNRKDAAVWKWTAYEGNDVIGRTNISVHVQYLPFLTALTVNGSGLDLVGIGQSVHVDCFWEKGRLPARVSLTDSRGNVLRSSPDIDEHLNHTFRPVHCRDSNTFRCRADGSDQYLSAVLLVKCPPIVLNVSQTNFTLDAGTNGTLTFSVLTHAPDIRECQLTQLGAPKQAYNNACNGNHSNALECTVNDLCSGLKLTSTIYQDSSSTIAVYHTERTCQCDVTGTAPEVTVTVKLAAIGDVDSGEWQLNISNDWGSALCNFSVRDSGRNTASYHLISDASEIFKIVLSPVCVILGCAILFSLLIVRKRKIQCCAQRSSRLVQKQLPFVNVYTMDDQSECTVLSTFSTTSPDQSSEIESSDYLHAIYIPRAV